MPLPALPGASKATVALTEACSRCVHYHTHAVAGIAQSARPSHPPPTHARACGSPLREDKLAAVALQCGLELRREEEARAVGAYYTQASHGRVPFPVAMIWYALCFLSD